jgi:C-terminal processing protease CtpA/Prc
MDGRPRHLLDFIDRSGTVEQSFFTLAVDGLLVGTKGLGGRKPLYVLTTKNTISGGEDMAYGLQASRRATVIGEGNNATAGAANPINKPNFSLRRNLKSGG